MTGWESRATGVIVAIAMMLASFAATAGGTVSGSLTRTDSPANPGVINFTCQGTPTCAGSYTATIHDATCNATNSFSGPMQITGFDPSQPTSSGTLNLANFISYTAPCPSTVAGTISGPYTATSDGTSGSMSAQVSPPGASKGATLQGPFSVTSSSTVGMTLIVEEGTSAANFLRVTATCYGQPTCTGVFSLSEQETGCNNGVTADGTITVTGVALSHPGSFGGTIQLSVDPGSPTNVNGACTYPLHPGPLSTYTATWDGVNGTLTTTSPGEPPTTGRITAAGVTAPPVFPMTVTSSITPTTSTVTAQIQPRAQDAGTTQSIFVFAYAPQSIVTGKRSPAGGPIRAALEDGPDPCVLAQQNSNGQLTTASSSTLTPTTTTVLTSQGSAVSVLTNTPTPGVAGATVYVGYGPNSTTMFGTGTYQGAANIPGATQCTTNLANSAAATLPGALTGLWWKADESGWGIHLTQRGTNVFAAWYTYDGTGKPKWYVSTCASGAGATTGTCSGALFEVTGPNFFGGAFNTTLVNAVSVGTLQLNFSNPASVAMNYTVSGQTRSLALTRQPLATGTAPPAIDFSDIWWGGASESGWGMAMAEQFGITFLAWYVYDATGKPTWLVATCTMTGTSCAGTLYRTTGPPFGPTFDMSAVQATPAGTISVSFTDPNNAILNYTVDGVSGSKRVTRQIF